MSSVLAHDKIAEVHVEKRLPFYERLRYERERRGWSQADVAEKVRCDTKTVGRWESGERLPRPYHRQALCELLGKSAEELGLLQGPGKYLDAFPALSNAMNRQAPAEVDLVGYSSPSHHREDWG